MDGSDWTEMVFLHLNNRIPKVPCIYFLFNDWELIYVGQTVNLETRIYTHRTKLNDNIKLGDSFVNHQSFNKIGYLSFDWLRKNINKDEMNEKEMFFINEYKPKYNR